METQNIVITTAFVISLILGIHNLYLNVTSLTRSKNIQNAVLVVSSFLQFTNQCVMITLENVPADTGLGSVCNEFVYVGDVAFLAFTTLSVLVLLKKITVFLSDFSKMVCRIVGTFALATSIAFTGYSIKQHVVFPDTNRCGAIYDPTPNSIGKSIMFCIYGALLLIFMVPARSLLAQTKKGKNVSKYTKIINSVSIHLTFALVAYLVTVSLALANAWGPYFYVQFSIENYCSIWAATIMLPPKPKKELPAKRDQTIGIKNIKVPIEAGPSCAKMEVEDTKSPNLNTNIV